MLNVNFSIEFFQGYIRFGSEYTHLSFSAPIGASNEDLDMALLGELSEYAEFDYGVVGTTETSATSIEVFEGYIRFGSEYANVSFCAKVGASNEERELAFLEALREIVEFDYGAIGTSVM